MNSQYLISYKISYDNFLVESGLFEILYKLKYNDGYKDIFVANGIYKDLLDQDYVNFLANPSIVSNIIKSEKEPIKKLIDMIPTEPLSNFAFKNILREKYLKNFF